MKTGGRQEQAVNIIETFLVNNPDIKEALNIFQISENEYFNALSTFSQTEIISSDSAYIMGGVNGQLDRHS